jgi:hypothetical protein
LSCFVLQANQEPSRRYPGAVSAASHCGARGVLRGTNDVRRWAETRHRCRSSCWAQALVVRRGSDDASTVATKLPRSSAVSPAHRPVIGIPSSRRRAQGLGGLGERVASGPSRRTLGSILSRPTVQALRRLPGTGGEVLSTSRLGLGPEVVLPPPRLGGRVPKQKVGEPSPISSTRS